MEEILKRLDAIDSQLNKIYARIDGIGSDMAQNFTTLDERNKKDIKYAVKEIIEALSK